MKYNVFNRKYETFQKKFDEFEKKYFLEIQDYREFKKENFSGVEKFSRIIKRIWTFISITVILFCIIMAITGLFTFLLFTVFRNR